MRIKSVKEVKSPDMQSGQFHDIPIGNPYAGTKIVRNKLLIDSFIQAGVTGKKA